MNLSKCLLWASIVAAVMPMLVALAAEVTAVLVILL